MKPSGNIKIDPSYASYFRPEIDAMEGYTPGEQPKDAGIIKLNTNENPYPPAPGVFELLKSGDMARLRLYPDPVGSELRRFIASLHGLNEENVIVGNGSDDILTIVARAFSDKTRAIACPDPTYSLYPVLAQLQNAPCLKIPLEDSFTLPKDFAEKAKGANIVMLARPNAPTGNSFPKADVERLCASFKGIVLIDEAYVDFADDDCSDFVRRFSNVIVSRTFSKSRSLAGLRFGYALANAKIIEGMMKVKDSYNVNYLTQILALASLKDPSYLDGVVAKVKASREALSKGLKELGFKVEPSQTNFVFAAPPSGDGRAYFQALRERKILVRYFPGLKTGAYVRITVGTPEQMDAFLAATKEIVRKS